MRDQLDVCFLVPRRSDGGHRDAVWELVKAKIEEQFPDWPIIEGEHRPGRGPFNRSKALNKASMKSKIHGVNFDVYVILDSDTLPDWILLRQAVARAFAQDAKVCPFTRRKYLTREVTMQILETGEVVGEAEYQDTSNHSACFAVSRVLWDRVNGFDQRFVGWGGEDTAFDSACEALGSVERLNGDCLHLWHETSPEADRSSLRWKEGKLLADRYKSLRYSASAMERLVAERRTRQQTLVLCVTRGQEEDQRTIWSLADIDHNLHADYVGRRILYLDNRSPAIGARLRQAVAKAIVIDEIDPAWEVVRAPAGRGPRGLVMTAVGSGQPWVYVTRVGSPFCCQVDLPVQQETRVDPRLYTRRELLENGLTPSEVLA